MIMPVEDFLGKKPRINPEAYVHPTSYIIGDVEIGRLSSVWHYSVIRGDNDMITLGEGTNVQENCSLHTDRGFKIRIGDFVSIGHNAVIHGAEVGNNVIIGMGAILLNGARVGDNVIIGAGAVVTEGKEIPSNSLALGVPAKVLRKLTQEEINMIKRNALEYIEEIKILRKSHN